MQPMTNPPYIISSIYASRGAAWSWHMHTKQQVVGNFARGVPGRLLPSQRMDAGLCLPGGPNAASTAVEEKPSQPMFDVQAATRAGTAGQGWSNDEVIACK